MNIDPELLRRLEFIGRRLTQELSHGGSVSVFRGLGLEFEEVRGYSPGDDARLIDWNVTARTGIPHIKVMREERGSLVMIYVDTSASMHFGEKNSPKWELTQTLAAMWAFLAAVHGHQVGLIGLDQKTMFLLEPQTGWTQWNRILTSLQSHTNHNHKFDREKFLRHRPFLKSHQTTVVVSDFLGPDMLDLISRLKGLKDVTCCVVRDGREEQHTYSGFMHLQDSETQARQSFFLSKKLAIPGGQKLQALLKHLKSWRCEADVFMTAEDPLSKFVRLMQNRKDGAWQKHH